MPSFNGIGSLFVSFRRPLSAVLPFLVHSLDSISKPYTDLNSWLIAEA